MAIINSSVSKGDLITPPIRAELLDELLKDYQKPEDLLGRDSPLQQLTKALVERTLDGELTHHLGYEKHSSAGDNSGDSRNGTTPKTMRGKRGQAPRWLERALKSIAVGDFNSYFPAMSRA